MDQFIYFVVVNKNKDLLKTELALFHTYLSPSFSKGDFLTYKNKGSVLSEASVKNISFAFALDWGISKGKLTNESIDEYLKAQVSTISLPEYSPSRAYLKIAEACKTFNIRANDKLNWIEFGSAPGGASLYILENFGKLTGVDPGKMDSICLEHSNYNHLTESIQNLTQEELPDYDIHYIASDVNLNAKQAIKEVIRLSFKYKTLRGIFMTVKMVKAEHAKLITEFENMFLDKGFTKTTSIQLPSHKREFLLFAQK